MLSNAEIESIIVALSKGQFVAEVFPTHQAMKTGLFRVNGSNGMFLPNMLFIVNHLTYVTDVATATIASSVGGLLQGFSAEAPERLLGLEFDTVFKVDEHLWPTPIRFATNGRLDAAAKVHALPTVKAQRKDGRDRFTLSMSGSPGVVFLYEFMDCGEVIERGGVARPRQVDERFEEFKALRLKLGETGTLN